MKTKELTDTGNIATTKEQSARLLACGVPPETADMAWVHCKETADDGLAWETEELVSWPYTRAASTFDTTTKKKATPAWSLSALLEKLLPKHIDALGAPLGKNADGEIVELPDPAVISGDVLIGRALGHWHVSYHYESFGGFLPSGESLIEAVVQTVELLHLNGYKFN